MKNYTFGKKKAPEGEVRSRLRAHIMAGGTPKEFAAGQVWHATTAGKMLDGMGIRKIYITDEEREHIMKRRKGGAA